MKDILKIVFMLTLVIIVYIYRDTISTFITDEILYKGSNKVLTYNEYYLDYDYKYVQNIDTGKVNSKQELLNMFYTIINSGDDSFSFYCNYNECIKDVKILIKDKTTISDINNFVNPFNSFTSINVDVDDSGKITVKTKKLYNSDQILYIKTYIETFITTTINESMSNYDKIKLFHDFVINNTIYDEDNVGKSYNAYNLIITGKSICGGYSDMIAIYLNMIGIQNYKISSNNHIWNLINLDGVWYHLDATWDDPVASDGKQYLINNFFLISTDKLLELDKVEHNFDKSIYLEAK